MTKLLFFLSLAFLLTGKTLAQSNSITDSELSQKIYTTVSEPPKFIGDFNDFVEMTIVYPQEAWRKKAQVKIYVEFVVEKDSSISNVRVAKEQDDNIDSEAIRVINQTNGRWIPAKNNGQLVRFKQVQAIIFKLGY